MSAFDVLAVSALVALRKESVDRNIWVLWSWAFSTRSLSARRAWIEITMRTKMLTGCAVALRKESVDRNVIDS